MSTECVLCHSTDLRRVWQVKNANFSDSVNEYWIAKCDTCGLCLMDPFPSEQDVKGLYVAENTFSQPRPGPTQGLFSRFLEPLYKRLGNDRHFIARTCKRLVESGDRQKILDVGCSTGSLLEAFARVMPNAELTGVDLDPMARVGAPEYLRDQIIVGPFLGTSFAEAFDIITFRFVIEHLPDPVTHVRKAISLLRRGGVLMISTPDIDSAKARQQKTDWNLINDPAQRIGHLMWFNRSSIDYLSNMAGLRIAHCCNRGELYYQLPKSLQRLLLSILGREPEQGRFIRYYPIRMLWAILFDGVLSENLSYGDGLYVFLVKP